MKDLLEPCKLYFDNLKTKVEEEAAKDDSVDPKDIESIIEHRNVVAKQAENNSGMSL